MKIEEIILMLYFIFIILILIIFSIYTTRSFFIHRENKQKFISTLFKELNSKNSININDIKSMKEALGLDEFITRKYIKSLHFEEGIDREKLRLLIQDIQKEEPFDDCPIELKNVLITLENKLEKDKGLLSPITKALEELNQNRKDLKKVKKQSYIAYLIGIISFIIGLLSFYFTLQSPSKEELKTIIELSIKEKPSK